MTQRWQTSRLTSTEHNGTMPNPDHLFRDFWTRLRHDERHGPLPALLLIMTATTGIVDAVSILSLGRVFVANMTGNVVFVGFALAGAKGFSLAASLFALGGFILGAVGGGAAIRRWPRNRAELLRDGVGIVFSLFLVALVIALIGTDPVSSEYADAIAFFLATALGVQNAVVRKLAVPDLTTTVLTMTLTGIAADRSNGDPTVIGRRILAVTAMLAGAVGGALLVLHVSPAAALSVAAALMGIVVAGAILAAKAHATWQD
jgi:uncharacterized membrane protein YoaK (UPF0700 family)